MTHEESSSSSDVQKNDPPTTAAAAATPAGVATAQVADEAAAVAATGSKKRVIAVDIDEVLGKFVLQLCKFHNEKYPAASTAGGAPLTPEHFVSYNFHEVWGGTREEADDKMRGFFESPHFVDGIPTIDGAAQVLRKHSNNFELHVVTSRQHVLQDRTRQWVNEHYRGIFSDRLHFGNHYSSEGVVRSKPQLCKSIGAVAIIDDNTRYATQCAAAGIPAYLFGEKELSQLLETNRVLCAPGTRVHAYHRRALRSYHMYAYARTTYSSTSRRSTDTTAPRQQTVGGASVCSTTTLLSYMHMYSALLVHAPLCS